MDKANPLDEVMAFSEASEIWGLGESTLRSAVKTDRLVDGVDYRKSGKVWIITKAAMLRTYGEPKNAKVIIEKESE